MDPREEVILKVTKEIVVKFIETGRLSTGSFEDAYKMINRVVRESLPAKPPKAPEKRK